ncbi:MAG: peptide-N-glycosidase [Cytophagales bacterium]|nr:MAG: peptide-N-glycosidase [Cytophagales bacterium]
MTRHTLFLTIMLWFSFQNGKAQEVIHVITHNRETVVTDPSTGAKSYRRWGIFPTANVPVRKIIMHVNFGCPDTMRCADWDYSDRISIRRKGGVNGASQDYEIGRMLTPYGGAFGKDWHFEWALDVTDFSLLLRDSVEIDYNHTGYEPNIDRGWAITVDFEIIKGQPAYNPIAIQKIYDSHFKYGDTSTPIEKTLAPVSFLANPKAQFARLRLVQTGHGMDKPDGCAEFCTKYRELWYDGKLIEKKDVWKQCGDNSLYPQAGTWLIDRAYWCPGNLMQPDIFNLAVKKGATHTIDVNMQDYTSPSPSAYWNITAYLIQYEKPQNALDVAVEDVIVPSSKAIYKRQNPSGANPKIVVKNEGSTIIQSLKIQYGTVGFEKKVHDWTGQLLPFQSKIIELPNTIDFKRVKNRFHVELLKPNGNKDGYLLDNTLAVNFDSPPVHDSLVVFSFFTNNQPEHNAYSLKNSAGKIIFEKKLGAFQANTEYRDTFRLAPDAYEFTLIDTARNGLEFWFNSKGGRGVARFLNNKGEMLKAVESDFGSIWTYNFVVGGTPNPIKSAYSIGLFPTRTRDKTTLDYFSNKPEDVIVRLVTDSPTAKTIADNKIVEEHHYTQLKEGVFTYDLKRYPKGRFYLKVIVNGEEKFNKRVRYNE